MSTDTETDVEAAAIEQTLLMTSDDEFVSEEPARRRPAAPTTGERVRLVLAHVCVYLAALIFVAPLVYAFFSALKPNEEMFSMPPTTTRREDQASTRIRRRVRVRETTSGRAEVTGPPAVSVSVPLATTGPCSALPSRSRRGWESSRP